MVSKCPWCSKMNSSNYQGVVCDKKPYYKVFQCQKSECRKYYTIEIMIEGVAKEEKLHTKREIDSFFNKRTACPLCTKYKRNISYKGSSRELLKTDHDFEYKHVVYWKKLDKLEKNHFYCNNHAKFPFRQKYQFVTNISEKNIMGLGRFITESTSQYFYNKVREIYKEGEGKYPFKEDPKNILSFLYSLGIPQTLLARIFHTSQPTIYRLIEKKKFSEPKRTIYIEKNHSALFYTKIKISKRALAVLKHRWRKNILNP